MNWRRLVNIAVPIVLAYWTIRYIVDDRALLAAIFTAILVANLCFDFVNWMERRNP